ncbi:myosin-4-like [Periplaneta americana]|uniref:myosin-4-like n=1 Tax=Periplaneta americana TaxID=6978 RepID=UPI0037E7AE02
MILRSHRSKVVRKIRERRGNRNKGTMEQRKDEEIMEIREEVENNAGQEIEGERTVEKQQSRDSGKGEMTLEQLWEQMRQFMENKLDNNSRESREQIKQMETKLENNSRESKEQIKQMENKLDNNSRESREQMKQMETKLENNSRESREQILRESREQIKQMENRLGESSREIRDHIAKLAERGNKMEDKIEKLEGKLTENGIGMENQLKIAMDRMSESMKDLEVRVRDSATRENSDLKSAVEEAIVEKVREIQNSVEEKIGEMDQEVDGLKRAIKNKERADNECLEELRSKLNSINDVLNGGSPANLSGHSSSDRAVSRQEGTSESPASGSNINVRHVNNSVGEECQTSRDDVRSELINVNDKAYLGRPQYPTHILNEIGYPIFDEVEFSNPHNYISELETYFRVRGVPDDLKMAVVRKSLKSRPLNWALVALGDNVTYEEFREKFSERYWGQRQQQRIRKEINQSRFDAGRGVSMIDYFLEIVKKGKSLNPPIPDSELIQTVISQYPENIRYNLIVAGPRDFGETIDLLTALDGSDATHYECSGQADYEHGKGKGSSPTDQKAGKGASTAFSSPRTGAQNQSNWGGDRSPNNAHSRYHNGHNGGKSPNRERRIDPPFGGPYNNSRNNQSSHNRMRNDRGGVGPVRRVNHIRWYTGRQENGNNRLRTQPHWLRNRNYRQGFWQPNFSRGPQNRGDWRRQEQERDRRDVLQEMASQGCHRPPTQCNVGQSRNRDMNGRQQSPVRMSMGREPINSRNRDEIAVEPTASHSGNC